MEKLIEEWVRAVLIYRREPRRLTFLDGSTICLESVKAEGGNRFLRITTPVRKIITHSLAGAFYRQEPLSESLIQIRDRSDFYCQPWAVIINDSKYESHVRLVPSNQASYPYINMWEYGWGVYETYPSGMEAVSESKMYLALVKEK